MPASGDDAPTPDTPAPEEHTPAEATAEPANALVFEERIGTGGAAQVYRVRDSRLGRLFALKAYRRRVDDIAVRVAFEHESRIATQLGAHPHIATVHGAGVTDGRPWLATELVEGGSLAKRLKGGALSWAEALRVAITTAETLDWAHNLDAPVLHRDVTPANVLLDQHGRPVLTDFGIASAGDSPGRIAGYTPSYSAPEVLSRGRYSVSAEIWSVTAVLHQMLTGATPFRYDARRGITAFVQQQLSRAPRLDPHLPPALADVVRAGLSPDPADRPTSMLALSLKLRAVERELGFTPTPRTERPRVLPSANQARTALADFDADVVLPGVDDESIPDTADSLDEVTADVRPETELEPEVSYAGAAAGVVRDPSTASSGLRVLQRRSRRPAPPVVAAAVAGSAAAVIGLLLTIGGTAGIVAGGPDRRGVDNKAGAVAVVDKERPKGGDDGGTNAPPGQNPLTPLPPWAPSLGDSPLAPTGGGKTGTTPGTGAGAPAVPVVPGGPVVGPVVPPVVGPVDPPVVVPPVVVPPVDPPVVDPPVVDPPVVDPPVDPPVVDPPVVDPPVVDPPVVDPPDPPVVDPPDPPVVDPPVVDPPDPPVVDPPVVDPPDPPKNDPPANDPPANDPPKVNNVPTAEPKPDPTPEPTPDPTPTATPPN